MTRRTAVIISVPILIAALLLLLGLLFLISPVTAAAGSNTSLENLSHSLIGEDQLHTARAADAWVEEHVRFETCTTPRGWGDGNATAIYETGKGCCTDRAVLLHQILAYDGIVSEYRHGYLYHTDGTSGRHGWLVATVDYNDIGGVSGTTTVTLGTFGERYRDYGPGLWSWTPQD